MRDEYRRQDFTALDRGKFYSETATEKTANGNCSNQISKAITMNVEELIALALQLETADRADMAAVLQTSLPPPDPEIERLWQEEALRRVAAHRRGESVGIPPVEVLGRYDSE
jgi:hypothetical protein